MRHEGGEFPGVRRLLTQEVLPAIRDFVLEPIRCSQAVTRRITYLPTEYYQELSRTAIFMWRVRGHMLGYLPIEMPVIMTLSVAMEGNIGRTLLFGGSIWVIEAALLRLTERRQAR